MITPPPIPNKPPRKPAREPKNRQNRMKKMSGNFSKIWLEIPDSMRLYILYQFAGYNIICIRGMDMPFLKRIVLLLLLVFPLEISAAERVNPDTRVVLDNGDVYLGQLTDGVRHGQGVYTWKDGRRYQGRFEFGKRAGEGTLEWPNGNTYQGQFLDNQLSGQGVFTWANEDRYEGDFVSGRRTGKGRYSWKSGDVYEGEFLGGQLQGTGTFLWADGRIYRGGFRAGLKTGRGIYNWPNNNRYDGEFDKDERHGNGVYYWRDGTVYHGHFTHNRSHGHGVKFTPDGLSEFQLWEDGRLITSVPIFANPKCALEIDGIEWMFKSASCINGLAHGKASAVSIDGTRFLADAAIILGNLVSGEIEILAQASAE